MMQWVDFQKALGVSCSLSGKTLYAPPLSSRYFALGASKDRRLKLPFLAIQPNESAWMKLVKWEKAVIKRLDSHLYLISSTVEGDRERFPDVPAFAFAISFDDYAKLALLDSSKILDGREYFIDSDGSPRVNRHSSVFKLQLERMEKGEEHLPKEALVSYSDLLSMRESSLAAQFGDSQPTFKGGFSETEETKGLFQKLKDKLL